MVSQELHDWVSQYIQSEISLSELEDKIVNHLPSLAQDPRSDDTDLVSAIELCLAEHAADFRSERDIRNYLRSLLNTYPTVIARPQSSNASGYFAP